MTKESKYGVLYRPEFRETFNDEFTVRRNGGIPTDVTFENGVGSFNGSSSRVVCKCSKKSTISIRIKLKGTFDSNTVILDFRGTSGTGYIQILGPGNNFGNSNATTNYVNGVVGEVITDNEYTEIICTGLIVDSEELSIGSSRTPAAFYSGEIDLVEVYNRELTAEEVSNLYEGKTYQELPDKIDENTYKILDVHSENGCLKDDQGNTLTPTDVGIAKLGSNIYSPDFNGSTSKIDVGNIDPLTGDKTFLIWINSRSFGEGGSFSGYILSNDKLIISHRLAGYKYAVTSDGFVTLFQTDADIVELNKWTCLGINRNATGLIDFYKNGVLQNSTQPTGTPTAGTTNIIIGNKSDSAETVDGLLSREVIYNGLLSPEQHIQFYTSTKWKYN